MTNNVHPIFAALLSDVREATQTLANCAAKGKLQPNGARMSNEPKQPPIPRDILNAIAADYRDGIPSAAVKGKEPAYDPKCQSLAEDFLDDHRPFTEAEAQDLAQTIQDAIESWFADRESRTEEQP